VFKRALFKLVLWGVRFSEDTTQTHLADQVIGAVENYKQLTNFVAVFPEAFIECRISLIFTLRRKTKE
jgi:hypothetical protein